MILIEAFLLICSLLLFLPALWFCIQVVVALRPDKPELMASGVCKGTIAVLIPAHNESVNLLPTLHAVKAQNLDSVRVLVVADNCNDDTADLARAQGVEVVERSNATLRGKGYALDFGLKHLAANPPEVVIILDADCLPEPCALELLADEAVHKGRPVQALYLMSNAGGAVSVRAKIAEFAWLVKNHVRPRGMYRLGLPCQLTGSGMAFPWAVINKASLATGEIVEDMMLGMSLASAGHPPVFSEYTVVRSTFPSSGDGVRQQRTRWEHGHLSMIVNQGVPKSIQAFREKNWPLFFMALDLCIPPLALLLMFAVCWTLLTAMYFSVFSYGQPLLLSVGALGLIGVPTLLAWRAFGRAVLSGKELLCAPLYMLAKLPVYAGFLWRRQAEWVRSKRDHEDR